MCRRRPSGRQRPIRVATHCMLTAVVRAPPTARRCFPRWTSARGQRIGELAASNPHSDRVFDNHRDMRRGFLPQGLSNTCPQAGVMRRPVLLAGQMSDKPKRCQSFVTRAPSDRCRRHRSLSAAGLFVAPLGTDLSLVAPSPCLLEQPILRYEMQVRCQDHQSYEPPRRTGGPALKSRAQAAFSSETGRWVFGPISPRKACVMPHGNSLLQAIAVQVVILYIQCMPRGGDEWEL